MRSTAVFRRGVVVSALAGVLGGLVFGAAMTQLGMLPTIAALVRAESPMVGFVVHMLIAAIIGIGFGLQVWYQKPGVGETLFWGLSYGALWWFLGPLTLMPLLLEGSLAWSVPSAQAVFPSLVGHLWYGATVGLAVAILQIAPGRTIDRVSRGALLRGVTAGLAGAVLLHLLLNAQDTSVAMPAWLASEPRALAWLTVLLIGALAGVGYALLYPRPLDGAGPQVVRGVLYGFFGWIAVGLTVVPLVTGAGLPWTVESVRVNFAGLIGFLLLGASTALVYHWLDRAGRLLFDDPIAAAAHDDEGIGVQGLRAVGRGVVAGGVGGLLFTLVMLQIGFLPAVASLVGATSPLIGLLVHLAIAFLIGASYGVLFRGQSFDVSSAIGWGISYGFVWWLLGPLTLMPIVLGGAPVWTVEAAATLMASLVGHLAYGAGVGMTFHHLESRYSPWWISRTRAEAERVARRQELVLTSAPALWMLVMIIALTLPVVLSA